MFSTTSSKIVIFEEINKGNYNLARGYSDNGFTVGYFHASSAVDSYGFKNLAQWDFNSILLTYAGAAAHKNINSIFYRYYGKSASIKTISSLLGSLEIVSMYKKEILLYLNDLYYLEYKINEVIKSVIGEVIFYPSSGFEIHSDATSPLLKRVKVVNNVPLQIRIRSLFTRLREFVLFLYPFYILFKKVNGVCNNDRARKKYQVGISVDFPAMLTWNALLIEYLLNPVSGIPKKDILFVNDQHCDEIPSEYKEQGYAYTDFLHSRTPVSKKFLNRVLREFIPAWCTCAIQAIGEDRLIVKTTRLVLTDYLKCNLLLDTYDIKNHINVLLPPRYSQYLVRSTFGCKTFFIYPDNTSADYHTGWDENIPVSMAYTYIGADVGVVSGNKIKRFFVYQNNDIKQYIEVGILQAQRINEIREGTCKSELTNILTARASNAPRISVFDTTPSTYGYMRIKDGLKFINDILHLLEDFPEVEIIFKEKKTRSFRPELFPAYELLERHPRCITIKKSEKSCIFASDVIAKSDLVISAAYTSTATEAWGARTKSIYYDVVGGNIGDNFYFNKFPNFVAHDYSQLKKLVEHWLYNTTPQEFSTYLETYVKGEIDPYLDGRAAERLTKLLMAN